MDIIIIAGVVLLIFGIAESIIPHLPGSLLGYIAILLQQLRDRIQIHFSLWSYIVKDLFSYIFLFRLII